ncbi:MAG: shikimate kinase [Gammaproteobacteria bacterium]|nr:shikimate kinase [Pseudomonadota bacterium]MCH9663541.1 shikimate kinase [Gammaproteobacteria bacterium]
MNNTATAVPAASAAGGIDRIFLVGSMGAGKTTLGRALAQMLSWQFIDLDDRIERRAERSISDVFASQGEEFFRGLEQECLMELGAINQAVVATGGGTVLRKDNRQFLRDCARHYCVYLSVSASALINRLDGDDARATRPLLSGADWRNTLTAALKKRHPLWQKCAHLTISTDNGDTRSASARLFGRLPAAVIASAFSARS